MKPFHILSVCLFAVSSVSLNAQDISLENCFRIAEGQNILIQQTHVSLSARQYNLAAEKMNYLPKLDALASYTYLSRPLEINLQTVRNGVVEGSSLQAVNAANSVFREITGSDLSQASQDRIYNSSKDIISAAYPNYNPPLSKQSYFLAGLALRQPIFLGNRLNAARNFAESEVASGRINTELVKKDVVYAIALQYIRIMYLNGMLQTQDSIITAFVKNDHYGEEMVKNQVLAPYQKSWTKVLLAQAKTSRNTLLSDKRNAVIELNKLMGAPLDSSLTITRVLQYGGASLSAEQHNFWEDNPTYQLAQSKIATAKVAEKINKTISLPNIFAVGNLNLYQNDLPVTMAPWMAGVEMQWNLYGSQSFKRKKAAQKLVEEVKLAEENTKESLQMQLVVAKNKIETAADEVNTMDSARKEIATTRKLVNERVLNQMSSLKDLNDVILMQAEIEKAYQTTVLGYYIALATYWNITGTPQRIAEAIQ